MTTPKLVVTVALFTVLEDFNREEVSAKNLRMPDDSTNNFGLGLFVVTRRSNTESSSTSQTNEAQRVLPERAVGEFESMHEAAHNLVADELGIEAKLTLRQVRIFDNPDRDQRQRTISVTYWGFANLEDVAPVLGGRDQVALELVNSSEFLDKWASSKGLEQFDGVCRFGYRQAPVGGRAHMKRLPVDLGTGPVLDQDHDEMVFLSWRLLRRAFTGKLDPFRYLGAKALTDAFPLSDLRELHDVSRGERSQTDQFRRAMLSEDSFLQQSESSTSRPKRPGKPATLYTLREWADPSKSSTEGSDD